MNTEPFSPLDRLARLYGVSPVFRDGFHLTRRVSVEALCAILRALGAHLESPHDAIEALRARRIELWERLVEPVLVSWSPQRPGFTVRVSDDEDWLECELRLEDGSRRVWREQLHSAPARAAVELDGRNYVVKKLALPHDLPLGYHQLRLASRRRAAKAWVFRAPRRTYPLSEVSKSGWGVFMPLYSLHTKRSWGAGDFSDLSELMEWSAAAGADVVGTLPLLAAFLDQPYDPSPYAPVSRLFWNEFFVDVTAVPEFDDCDEARKLVSSSHFRTEMERSRAASSIDYKRQMALKRRVLELLCSSFIDSGNQRRRDFEQYTASRPELQAYAAFRATMERQGKPWSEWPERLRSGGLTESDSDERVRSYHQYVQWLAEGQLHALADRSLSHSAGLYLDLPLGVHPAGFDVWREPGSFASRIAGGAPPDRFFSNGQNWGFAPVHPEMIRCDGYRHCIHCLRQHMRYARVLRIDHVMNLHRLYWIPEGFAATDGTYVGYHSDEFYAVLALESERHKTAVIGEDLGTVPHHIRASMSEHGLGGMYVTQFQFNSTAREAMRPTPGGSLASLNTHDMRPFAGFWEGLDIEDQEELGLIGSNDAREARGERELLKQSVVRFLRRRGALRAECPTLAEILEACLLELAGREEALMLVNLEDLWLERFQQNTPGTVDERPNWQRRARYGMEAVKADSQLLHLLQRVHRLRKRHAPFGCSRQPD